MHLHNATRKIAEKRMRNNIAPRVTLEVTLDELSSCLSEDCDLAPYRCLSLVSKLIDRAHAQTASLTLGASL